MEPFQTGLILDVARSAGQTLKRTSNPNEWLTKCIWPERHRNEDSHPSCRLNSEKNTFYCDPCGRGGGVIEFAKAIGIPLEGTAVRKIKTAPSKKPLVFKDCGAVSQATERHFADVLGKSYTSETWQAFEVREGVVHSEGVLDRDERAVAFPLRSGGVHVYHYFRPNKRKRWAFANGGKPDLITAGLDREDPVILAEGQWDAMRAYELGYAVATGTGAGTFKDDWGEILARRAVAVTYDVDAAGVGGSAKASGVLRTSTTRCWVINLPLTGDADRDGKDLCDFVAYYGPEAFHALVQSTTPPSLKAIRGCVSEGSGMSAADLLDRMRAAFPGLERALHAGLALHAYLCFDGSNRPCALFYVGPPSSGKSLVDRLFLPTPECPEINKYVYRCDDFTPASFVSRAANIATKRLAEIDLLPKLADRVLNTKELAPIFRGKADDLTRSFAVLTSILDGDGFVNAGGSVGTRGYPDPIFFCWLGATTPLSKQTWTVMAALGPRILFFETAAIEPTLEDLVRAQDEEASQEEYAMRLRVNGFLAAFFKRHPPRSIPEKSIECPKVFRLQIALHARFLARLRAGLSLRDTDDGVHSEARYEPPSKEHEFRLVKTLNRLAKASALIMGRTCVGPADFELIRDIVFSSAPETRRKVALTLLQLTSLALDRGEIHPVAIEVNDIARTIHCSPPTARHYAEELQALGIATYRKGALGDPHGGTLVLADDLRELALPDTHPRITFNPNDDEQSG